MITLLQEKINTGIPESILEYVNNKLPELRGIFYYDKERFQLRSNDNNYGIYFDPLHLVIDVYKTE